MKLTEKIFDKELDEITKKDFFDYFVEEREETSYIEYKSGEVEINDIYREVCAFLNTDGGIIFIGTPREKKIIINKKCSKRICQGEPVPSKFRNKGWIIQKLASNISPVPLNVRIKEILTKSGNYFIIEVPQSETPPHQCSSEGKYYIRLDESARPAPHGIVQALFFKRQRPKIDVPVDIFSLKNKPDNELEIKFYISNESNYPLDTLSYIIRIVNIEELISEEDEEHENSGNYKEKSKNIFELQNKVDIVLIKRINMPISFRIVHFFEPFILSIMVWGKDFELYEKHFLWDPINSVDLGKYSTGDNIELTYEALFNKLKEIKKNAL